MRERNMTYHVFLDDSAAPPMYGIRCEEGPCARRLSTDYQEVSRLAGRCNSAGLSPLHLGDVAEDFRRG
ncbi:hypothetical protein CE91St41_16680 [Oscillospiraceae bacterium]|nr:hypothetical protein CE91St40_20860 [Oscillospiraceae bacterium]BDF74779.1 hypothetical protein CE91St41_16680 [Oscillospiraceae bacterium]